jgi:hypothetical protein
MKIKYKIKYRQISVFLLTWMLLVSIVTCRQADDFYDYGESEPQVSEEDEQDILAAQYWYNRNKPQTLALKSGTLGSNRMDYSQLTELLPDWKHAKVKSAGKEKTVEAEFYNFDEQVQFINPNEVDRFHELEGKGYVWSVTRLVVRTNETAGITDGFMMTVIPSMEYNAKNKGNPYKNLSYLERDKEFDGSILYHKMEGEFVYGWLYQNGIITGIISPANSMFDYAGESEKPVKSGIGITNDSCQLVSFIIAEPICTNGITIFPPEMEAEDSKWTDTEQTEYKSIPRKHCSYADVGHIFVYLCDTQSDNTSSSSGGGGGGGGGGDSNKGLYYTARLSINSPIDVMDNYDLSIYLIAAPTDVSSMNIYIKDVYQSGAIYMDLYSSSSFVSHVTKQSKKPGVFSVYAGITMRTGQRITTNTETVVVRYPSVNSIMTNSTIKGAMDFAWRNTKSAASSNGRREFGFWIYVNTTGSSIKYETGPHVMGNLITGCEDTHASIALGATKESYGKTLLVGGIYTVACFHTHTPLTYCPSTTNRDTGPSTADLSYVNNNKIPGILYDYSIASITGGHKKDDAAHVRSFGSYDRRPYSMF